MGSEIADLVQDGLHTVANIPEDIHWICPNNGGATTEFDAETRIRATRNALMLFSFTEEQQANQEWLNQHLTVQLSRCFDCVKNFYIQRVKLAQQLEESMASEMVDMFFSHVREQWDKKRVLPLIEEAATALRSMELDAWTERLQKETGWRRAIYECFCDPALLDEAAQMETFRKLCGTGKLSIEGPAVGMVTFLFSDHTELRDVAAQSWETHGPAITPLLFDELLVRPLEAATREFERNLKYAKMEKFLYGLGTMMQYLDRDVILRCISGSEKDPIKLGISRLMPNFHCWPSFLRLMKTLMTKLGSDVWEVITPLTPSGFSDVVFKDRLFTELLQKTEQGTAGESKLLNLTEWMSAYIESIEPFLRASQAPGLLNQIMNAIHAPLSNGLCLKESMKVLLAVLQGAESNVGTGNTLVQHAFELAVGHLPLVSNVAWSTDSFEDALMGKHMGIAKQIAQEIVLSLMKIGVQFMAIDFDLLFRKKAAGKTLYAYRISDELWECFSKGLLVNCTAEYCKSSLECLRGLQNIDRLHVSTDDPLVKEKAHFNLSLAAVDRPLANHLKALGRCEVSKLEGLISSEPSCDLLLGFLMSRSSDVAIPAEDVFLAGLRAEDMADALRLMLVKDFTPTILALSSISRRLAKLTHFAMMPRWVKIGMTTLDVLCDKTQGLIRKRDFETYEKTLLRVYWEVQWRCLMVIFKRSRKWSLAEEKPVMIEFLRDSMDYAGTLFDNFWVFEQALCGHQVAGNTAEESQWTDRLLQDASKPLTSLVDIMSIQDDHLLQTAHQLMCKMLGLFDQKLKGSQRSQIVDDAFCAALKPMLHPEDPTAPSRTNLTEVQKTELSEEVIKLRPDFAPRPPEKQVIQISDDDYGDLSDSDMIKASQFTSSKTVQSKLDFSKAIPKAAVPKPTPLRVGAAKAKKEEEERAAFLRRRREEKEALARKKAAAIAKKKAETEPSSDEEQSSDDEGGNTLFKLGSRAKMVVKGENLQPLTRKKPTIKRPVIKREKDKRARIAPDLSPLYRQIFKWDFCHRDAFPPGLSAADYTQVAKSFKSYGAYKQTFEPLLILEAWQSFLKSKEELVPSGCLEVKISTRMKADSFVELETTVDNMDDRNRWSESDIIVLSTSKTPLNESGINQHCIARVNTINRKFRGPREVTLRCDPGPVMLQKMTNGGTLYGMKIMSLIPLEREYGSLIALQYYDLREEIMMAKSREVEEPTQDEISKTCQLYDTNEPQARAIIAATSAGSGFSLIQGPPGTGKTKTVIGIVGAMLTVHGQAIQVPGTTQKKAAPVTRKLLVCAPSNAAVDELVIRFKKGVRTTKGETVIPRIVRIGRSDVINAEVKDVTLEDLIDARMGPALEKGNNQNMDELREKHTKLMEERDVLQKELDDCRANKQDPGNRLQNIDALSATIRTLRRELDSTRNTNKENSRNLEIKRRQIQQEIMNEAHIICATLSGSGHEMLRNVNVDFETVIIDEAAQSVELSALIPLKFGCDKCILVGDPQQLPPTVLSREAAKFSYEKSLFVRIQENNSKNVHLLSIQYRMHPMISSFPSAEFYNSNLMDGEGMADLRTTPWHKSTVFGPYRFFDVAGKESRGGTSLINREEVQTAIQLFQRLTSDFPEVKFQGRVGIVTPYRQQLFELKKQFEGRFGRSILTDVEFNTVDAFQGRERDIILFSCVRAADEGGVGFLSDIRRMNVGLTRAKSSLFVLGNSQFLMRNRMWGRLVEDAKARDVFTTDTRKILSRSSRLDRNQAPAAPNQVDAHWDPMDIDEEPPANAAYQTSTSNGARLPPQEIRPPPQEILPPGQPPSVKPPQGPNNPSKPSPTDVTCRRCGKPGHSKKQCPQLASTDPTKVRCRRCHKFGHYEKGCTLPPKPPTPNIPTKRRHEPDNSGPDSKRPHTNNPFGGSTSSGNPVTSKPDNNAPKPDEPNKPPKPSTGVPPGPKKIIRRKDNSNPLLQRKPPPPSRR
ncbi:hypothetical protein EX30DRAFT_115713 [Ascodesmis nigricans]|uniref:CCHC-type domain-containing protein n=1 Tax=Ascodesmis nigricans TaxID=341454 RepID=A0A4S2MSS5_9PEZI|nr:hypothetical protein EX30DRAFT_115713 [Ascodesmis nigricans]